MKKTPADTYTEMTELVMPNDTNPLGNLMGGNLLKWMDVCSSISAARLSSSLVVTAAVDNVSFKQPIKLGEVVTIRSKVTKSFNTSMEVFLEVFTQNFVSGEKYKCNEAFYTFVALDSRGNKKSVPELEPVSDEEKKMFEGAQRRRELRLILDGKLDPKLATELRSIFMDGEI